MQETTYSGFFNSGQDEEHKREYQDIDFARMLSLITNGQGYIPGYGSELQVTIPEDLDMAVTVGTGAAWVGNPSGWWCVYDSETTITGIQPLGELTQRIDKVVLRLNRTTGTQKFIIMLIDEVNTSDTFKTDNLTIGYIYDMLLADVRVYKDGEETKIEIQDKRVPCINSQSKTIQRTDGWTLGLPDMHKFIRVNNTDQVNVLVPLNSNVPFPINTEIVFVQHGAGAISLQPDTGVTVHGVGTISAGQYTGFTLRKIGTDEWYALGSLTS